ncbi:hypothetical protein IFM89_029534 [Coptis chinensis]|uniref:RRM domain-containing protein n=1 Tax=Coptis chinensis TaxID=261450 RepID=A0A835H3B7_9MAGN|nr:hypothetical protein IFM89_029534 [Coptis chinensis]
MDPSLKKRKTEDINNNNGTTLTEPITGLTLEDARKIIEPLTQEQLIEIVQNSLTRHLDVLESVRLIADRDPTQRKLFIRGLGWDTTTENLRTLFSTYGELEEAVVILDKTTGKSKGYGFITFKHIDAALLALKEPSKKIDGRMTVTQLAAAGNNNSNSNNGSIGSGPGGVVGVNSNSGGDVMMRKIYVGNVPFDMPADRLLAHFLSYGEIEEGPLGFDKQTGKSKGFALFVYKTPEAARASLVDQVKTIDGHQVSCKLASEGKRKVGGGGVGTGQGEVGGDGVGVQARASMGNSGVSQFGVPGGIGMPGGYGGYGTTQVPGGIGHHHLTSSLQSNVGSGTGLSTGGNQVPSSLGNSGGYGAGFGNPYSGFGGGPASGAYGGPTSAYGGFGSLYRLPPGSVGLPSSGYPETGHYGLSSSAFPGQLHQASASSPVPRVPPGAMYPSLPPFY